VLAIAVGLNVGGLRDKLPGGEEATKIESIAVLPLDNLSGDPEQEYFADGMTETLITELSKIGALKVISRTSVMRFKDTDKSLPEIARELNVDAVVEGSVLRAGDRVRITAQLVHAGTDQHLWADNFDRELEDVLNLHSEVARSIAEEVEIQLTPEEESFLAADRQVNPEAHEAYLMGLSNWDKRTTEGFRTAIDCFDQAIETDPNFAPPYAALSNLYVTYTYLGYERPRNIMPKARIAALKALELDEHLAEAHTALGQILFLFDWDWPAAERELIRALELNPGSAYAHYVYGNYLAVGRGGMAESVVEHHRALELDPFSLPINWIVATDYLRLNRYDEAIERLQEIINLEPNNTPALWCLGSAYYFTGMHKESVAATKKIYESLGNEDVVEALDAGYEHSGFAGAMRSLADELVAQREKRYHPPPFIAEYYAFADEMEKAVQWLEIAFEEREPHLLNALRFGIVPDRLQSNPRFQDILERMNFPE
jgi:TolB-like protein/Tfp pilus assembly protein PilF